MKKSFLYRAWALGYLLLTLGATSLAHAGNRATAQLPVIQISGVFGSANGRQVIQAQLSGGMAFPGASSRASSLNSIDPLWESTDSEKLYARNTSDDFLIPALTATAGLTSVVSAEIFRAIHEHRSLDLKRLYRESIVATASGFAIGTLGAPGITNHFMAKAVVDATLRYVSKLIFMGAGGRENAGTFGTDLIVGALRGAIESQLPAGALTWLPCQKQDIPSDICNGLYALTTKSLIQGSEEIASQLLARGLKPDAPRLSTDLLASFFRGAAFGAAEQTLIELSLGAPQYMAPDQRQRLSSLFRDAGLSEGTQECMEKSTFLYGGLWSFFTRDRNINFNIGTTTMTDREIYFLDSERGYVTRTLTHEIAGHCTQWLNMGLVEFLSAYLYEAAKLGKPPEEELLMSEVGNQLNCTGNPYECEAQAATVTVVDVIHPHGNGVY